MLLFLYNLYAFIGFPFHQHHCHLQFSSSSSTSLWTVLPLLLPRESCNVVNARHCVPLSHSLCATVFRFCVFVFEICAFFLPFCFRSVYPLCHLFYHTTVLQIWFQQTASNPALSFPNMMMFSPPRNSTSKRLPKSPSEITVCHKSIRAAKFFFRVELIYSESKNMLDLWYEL